MARMQLKASSTPKGEHVTIEVSIICTAASWAAASTSMIRVQTHRVLNVLVAEPGLQRPRVVAGIGQRIAAAMAQHVRMESVEPQGRWLESGRKLIAMAPLGGEPSARRR